MIEWSPVVERLRALSFCFARPKGLNSVTTIHVYGD